MNKNTLILFFVVTFCATIISTNGMDLVRRKRNPVEIPMPFNGPPVDFAPLRVFTGSTNCKDEDCTTSCNSEGHARGKCSLDNCFCFDS